MKTPRISALLAVSFLVAFPACIETDESVTLYVAADGAVEFVAYLDDLRSDETDEAKRKKEEKELLADIRANKFLGEPLRKSGATAVKLRLLRETPPYAAVATGRYRDLVAYFRLFEFNDKPDGKTAALTREGSTRKLLLKFPAMTEPCGPEKRNEFPRRLKLVLTKDRFLSADGFALDAERRAAVLDVAKFRERCGAGKPFELSLSW